MTEKVESVLPPQLQDGYDVVSALGDRPQCGTFLLRGRDGSLAVLKRVSGGTFDDRVYEAVRALDGEGVPRMLGLYKAGGETYLLREYVEGRTLLETYRRRGPLSAREAAAIGAGICGILERLHSLDTPLIHRDIKAENVVRTPEGRCVLIDFDIARLYDESDERDTRVMGTGFASAPEQFGYAQTDPRSDIYSLGVLLHELSTGEFSLSNGKVPGALGRVVAKCTRFDPADRYQTAAELKNALSRIGRRRWPVVAAIMAAGLALVCAAVFLLPHAAPGGTPDTAPGAEEIYSFASPAIGREVARQLGKEVEEVTYGDLQWITALRLVGEESFDDWDLLMIHGEELSLNGQVESDIEWGSVDTLEDIPNLPNLKELALCDQRISDLTPLADCRLIRLALHGNIISDISPLGECAQLQELIISDNPVADLTPLAGHPRLWALNIGATDISSLDTLKEIPGLTRLEVHDCPNLTSLEGVEALTGLTFLSARSVSPEDLERIGRLTGLTSLYVWAWDYQEDLSAIGGLVELRRLFIDIPGLESLEGIEGLKNLIYLDFRGNLRRALNVAPLAGLTYLENVNFEFMYSDTGWSEVSDLVHLGFATISAVDEEAFRAALKGRDVVITVSLY